jgi:hypothetical protein
MASRKKPQTEAILDSSSDTNPPSSAAMTERNFSSIIRYIKKKDLDSVEALFVALEQFVKDRKIKLRKGGAVEGVPDGSDQFDRGTFLTWLEKIDSGDGAALAQVRLFYHTAKARVEL